MENDELAGLEINDRQRIFLEAIAAGMNFSEAAQHAGVDRVTTYRWRKDPAFQAEVDKAKEVSIEALEREAHRRAMRGSDRMLEFLLVNRAPDKYSNSRKIDLNGSLALNNMSDDEIRAELASLAAAGLIPTGGDDDVSDLV